MKHYFTVLFFCSSAFLLGQSPVVQSVLNNATNDTHLCPGVPARISGWFGSKPTVTVGGKPAYVFQESAYLLIIQIPSELSAGVTQLIVRSSNGVASQPMTLTLDAVAPGLMSVNSSGTGTGFFIHGAGGPVKQTRPASRGEAITVNAVGLGPTNPFVPTGTITPINAPTVNTPRLTMNGKSINVTFCGLPETKDISLVGTYRIAFTVPKDTPLGANNVELVIDGHTSNVVTLLVD